MTYQFDEPFIIDSADTVTTLGIEPTPLAEQIVATLAAYGVQAEPSHSRAEL